MCLTFVFGVLVECVIVQYIARSEKQRVPVSSSGSQINVGIAADDEVPTERTGGDEEQEIPLKDASSPSSGEGAKEAVQEAATKIKQRALDTVQTYVSKFESLPEKIDGVARVAFPAVFFVFIILYWPVYSLSA